MSKRTTDWPAEDGSQAYLKRQKIKHVTNSTEEIQSSKQLQQLLAFDQNIGRAKHGIQSFKVFLEAFSDEEAKKRCMPILKEYLQSQMPQDEGDKAALYMNDIMQTWSFASQSNNDSLLSAVPAVLALLFRTLSGMIDLTPHGIRLGRTLLQKRQLELFSRGLSSNKSKDYIISPSLRLIREVAAFDGGALINEVYRARDATFKALARNIGIRHGVDDIEDPRKPSVRTHALRFLLACIKFLPLKTKTELFSLRDVISGITRDISSDPPYLVAEILEGLKVHVLQDENLPRDAKSKLLHPSNLGRIAALYSYDRDDGDDVQQSRKTIRTLAHEFLMLVCTTPNMGVLYSKAGFYPRGIDPDNIQGLEDRNFIDLGLSSLEWANEFMEKVPVRNTILSEFIQSLRPWSDVKQSELLLAIFNAAPELVADYFFGKKSFSFEPKPTATWMGYSAFLFSVIQLPVPQYFGHQDRYARLPPPSSIVMESILPEPLTQKVLTRCLNQKSPLITFFAIRLLIVAFQKLQVSIKQYRKAADTGSPIWIQAEQQLTEMFCQKCPAMKDVIITFNNISETSLIQRQAASKLLVMYYESVPRVALESKFDVAARLTDTLRLMDDSCASKEDRAMRVMELESLFEIAHLSPGTRWFNKPESYHVSPFAAMLQLSAQASTELPLLKVRGILDSVIKESGIMQVESRLSSQDALISALKACNEKGGLQSIYNFLDNCALRCSTTPVKYIDVLEEYYSTVYGEQLENDQKVGPVSLILLAIAEQWPFVTKSSETKTIDEVAQFIANYVAASTKILEDKNVVKAIVKTLASACPEGSKAGKVIERSHKLVSTLEIPEQPLSSLESPETPNGGHVELQPSAELELSMLQITDVDADDHSALTKWINKEIVEVIEEGHAAALIMLLSSPHLSARKEAMSNIAKLALKLKSSSYDEREQIWLLLSELLETAKPHISDQPLPTTITAFASHALSVLRDPLHCLYPKVNKYLSQGPTWELDKFPLLHAILNEPPTLDDAHYMEVSFLLTYLTSGLRTVGDMAIFHKRHVFEKLLTLYVNPYLGKNLKEKILRVLWRATAVEGGSMTLITRLSTLSWLQARMKVESGNRGLKALMERLLRTCDEEKLKAWSHRSRTDFMAELQ